MFETLKLMNACTVKQYRDVSFEELADLYQVETNERIKSNISRTIFCRLFPMLYTIYNKFPDLPNEVRVETILMSIVKVLKYWGTSKTKAKFTTYLYGCVTNQLRTEITYMNCKKRETWKKIVPNNSDDGESRYLKNTADTYPNVENILFLEDLKMASNLSSEEKDYCACVLAGIIRGDELEEREHYMERQNLFSDPILKTRITKMGPNKIKQSLKKKLKEYGKELFYV